VWNGSVLGIATKKGYIAFDPPTESVYTLCENNNALHCDMLTFYESWIVISGDNACIYDKYCKFISGSNINIQATTKHPAIISMLVKKHYLVILRETAVNVYNLLDYTLLQSIEIEKGDIPKDLSGDDEKLLILYESVGGIKKEAVGKLVYYRLLPPNEQIQRLLAANKVNEACKVFNQNTSTNDPDFKSKREMFCLEAGWALFLAFDYTKAIEWLSNTNYDPFEFLALIPDFNSSDLPPGPFTTITNIVELKLGMSNTKATVLKDGLSTIVTLLAKKRKQLAPSYPKEKAKVIEFLHPSTLINNAFKDHTATLAKTMEMLDTSLIKLYIALENVKDIKEFFDSITIMGCDYKFQAEIDDIDSYVAEICLGYFNEKYKNFTKALEIWKKLAGEKEASELACKEIVKLLTTKITDKNLIFDCAEIVLKQQPEEGLKIFTNNDYLPKFITEDDIISYLGGLANNSEFLKEKYIEYIVGKPNSLEKYHTALALNYINQIKRIMKEENKDSVDDCTNQNILLYRAKINKLLRTSDKYNLDELLTIIDKIGMLEEQIYLYSKQKRHKEALSILTEIGKKDFDFSKAETYCLEQTDPLLDVLFEYILDLYKVYRNQYGFMEKDKAYSDSALKLKAELEELDKKIHRYEKYCKEYLRRYAANEKMNVETVIRLLPDDWIIQENDKDEGPLIEFMALAVNDRLSKENNCKVEKSIAEMLKLNLESELIRMQKAYVTITPEKKCKACRKLLNGFKPIFVYPNGVVVHQSCTKDPSICPTNNYNFAKTGIDF